MKQSIRPIRGYPGYHISNFGVVWSAWKLRPKLVSRGNEKYLSKEIKELKQHTDKRGYKHVSLSCEGSAKVFAVHRLVLETFRSSCPEGMECLHGDGNPSNNRLDNLRWGTHLENVHDSIRHGTFQNLTKAAAEATRGVPRTAEAKEKIAAAHRGKPKSEAHKAAIKATHWSKRPDAAEIAERSAAKHRGKVHTEEHKAKISAGNRRRWARCRGEL